MATNNDNQVAVFIDFENLERSCREKLGSDAELDWNLVLETAVDMGRVVIRRAYADWAIYGAGQRELLELGINPIHVPAKRGKNAADIKIVIDSMEMLTGRHGNVSHVLLVSGDGDFTELVHRLRAHGKEVVGLGVSGTSAEYLINACDRFVFYDALVSASSEAAKDESTAETRTISFDVSEARQLLRRVLHLHGGEWTSAGEIKNAMLRLNPSFSERNYNYASFKDFLESKSDLVDFRTVQPGGHLVVRMKAEADAPSPDKVPEALLDRYLEFLAGEKVRMRPTEHRPAIITRFYEIAQKRRGRTLNELKEELHSYFEANAPHIKWQHVHETVHQLFRAYCLEFDKEDSKYPPDVRLWDREAWVLESIRSSDDLINTCDRGLLRKVGKHLDSVEDINREVAARLLYGSKGGRRKVDHVESLIKELANQ
jgi:hypothetical protein